MKTIQNEMMERRIELINLQKKQGGVAGIQLKSDNLMYCYNPSKGDCLTEKFYVTGTLRGCPVILKESEILA